MLCPYESVFIIFDSGPTDESCLAVAFSGCYLIANTYTKPITTSSSVWMRRESVSHLSLMSVLCSLCWSDREKWRTGQCGPTPPNPLTTPPARRWLTTLRGWRLPTCCKPLWPLSCRSRRTSPAPPRLRSPPTRRRRRRRSGRFSLRLTRCPTATCRRPAPTLARAV